MIWAKEVLSVSGLALVIILAGCDKGPEGAVLAKVNRATITTGDFKKQFEDLTPQLQQALAIDTKMRKDYLEDLIGIELVIQEAKRQGLDKDAEFKKNMEAKKKKIEEYKKQLDQQLEAATRDELFNSMLKKDLGEKLKSLPAPTNREALDFYNKNKDKIRTATGKQVSYKDIEPQIKMRLMQEKQRPLYIEYTKSLKAKATISIDEKALDAAVSGLSQSVDVPDGLTVPKVPATK
jgi:peptidyl-prolyl cis-trans isomerase C